MVSSSEIPDHEPKTFERIIVATVADTRVWSMYNSGAMAKKWPWFNGMEVLEWNGSQNGMNGMKEWNGGLNKQEWMFGIDDPGIWLVYLLAFACVIFAIWFVRGTEIVRDAHDSINSKL